MQFSSKFSLMLNIFEVKNVDLSNELTIDRTLISKWRSGQRKPITNSEQIVQLSKYFAKLLYQEKNSKLFKSAFGLDDSLVFSDDVALCDLLINWFSDDSKNMQDLIINLSLHGRKQNITSNNDLLPSPILYFEGFDGYINASNYLISFLRGCDKSKKIIISMDYRMHMYLTKRKQDIRREKTFLQFAVETGHHIDFLINVSEHNLHYCIETFASFLTKDNYDNISFHCYNVHNPAPNHFIIIEDEIIEYGSFSDNTNFAPIIAHITTHDSIIKMFKHTYYNLLHYSHPVNLAKYIS